MMDGQKIGLAEAAARLRLPYQAAHRLVLVGILRGTKDGSRWLVERSSLEEYERSLQKTAGQ